MCNVSRSSLSVLSINSAHRSSAVRPIVTLVPPSLLVRSSSGSGGGGGQGFVVTAASDSLGAGRERFVPAADEPDPALHQLNRRRTATISTSLPPVRPISWIPSIPRQIELISSSFFMFYLIDRSGASRPYGPLDDPISAPSCGFHLFRKTLTGLI
ncbi:hypothetical protein B296_00025466 [Ensete ventricosum]|uniref:Uncharacterized protein n=1 Tax=Ensete ventricosum TaxID=4639 RepID=A0A426YCF9_ENSVE|nr:hypothetical protein B296_00025466 [Ensete ventricosum]